MAARDVSFALELVAFESTAEELAAALRRAEDRARDEVRAVVWFALRPGVRTSFVFDALVADGARQRLVGPMSDVLVADGARLLAQRPRSRRADTVVAEIFSAPTSRCVNPSTG